MVASSGAAMPCRSAARCSARRSVATGVAPGRSNTLGPDLAPEQNPASHGRQEAGTDGRRFAAPRRVPPGEAGGADHPRSRSATRRSRPKKNRASEASNGASPLNGQRSRGRPAEPPPRPWERRCRRSPRRPGRGARRIGESSSLRLDAPSFPLMFATWTDAVFLLMNSVAAILTVRPADGQQG